MECVNLLDKDIPKKVTEYIVRHYNRSVNPYNTLFIDALSSIVSNASEVLLKASQKTIEKTTEVKGHEPDIDAITLSTWLSRYRLYADNYDITSILVFARLVLLNSMIRGLVWIENVGQNMVVFRTEGGSRFTLTKFGVFY